MKRRVALGIHAAFVLTLIACLVFALVLAVDKLGLWGGIGYVVGIPIAVVVIAGLIVWSVENS